jgi:D-proline reductase (dithiol) PrdB
MSFFARLKNRLIAKLITRFPALSRRFTAAYSPQESREDTPWVPFTTPLRECTVAVVTTAGIHHRSQSPFDMQDSDGDPSWRELDGASLFDDFLITHDYYDHKDAEQDPNIILPPDRLNEFADEGRIGSPAKTHYAFMGHIDGPHIATLVNKTAPEVAQRLRQDQMDLVLLTPA